MLCGPLCTKSPSVYSFSLDRIKNHPSLRIKDPFTNGTLTIVFILISKISPGDMSGPIVRRPKLSSLEVVIRLSATEAEAGEKAGAKLAT